MKGFRSHHHPPSLDFFLAQHPQTFTIASIWRCQSNFRFSPNNRRSSEGSAVRKSANDGNNIEDAAKQHRNFQTSARLGRPWGQAISSWGDMPKYRVTHFCEALSHVPVAAEKSILSTASVLSANDP